MRKWAGILAAGLFSIAIPAFADTSVCGLVADNLVQNCGFETGTWAGWTYTGGSDPWFMIRGVPGDPHSGNEAALFGAMGTDDTLSQTLATTKDEVYTISFWLSNHMSDPAGADFHLYWDGTDLFDASSSAFAYTQFTFTVVGQGNDTLAFAGRQYGSIYRLDDVVVVDPPVSPVAESSGVCFLVLASGLLGLVSLRRALNSAWPLPS